MSALRVHALDRRLATVPSEKAGEWLLGALLIFLPWPYGSVGAVCEWVTSILAAGLALCMMKRMLIEKRQAIWTWAYVPLLALGAFALFSILPLPVSWIQAISPEAVRVRQESLSHLDVTVWNPTLTTLSLYPLATMRMLRLLICSGIVFAAVIHFYRTAAQVKRLLAVIAIVGAALATEALLQDISNDGLIYWSIRAPVKSTSGPFVNYNNFSQYMNLSIAGAMGLLLMLLHDKAGKGGEKLVDWKGMDDRRKKWVGLLLLMIAMAGVAVVFSSSRAGVLSLLAAGATVVVMLVMTRESRGSLKVLSLLGFGMVLMLVAWGFDAVWQRMATLSDIESASGARWQVFQDVAAFIPKFAIFGTGLGTHEMVYPMFSHLKTWRNAQYVENEYLQMVEEMGFLGLAIAFAFIATIAWNLMTIIRNRRSALAYAAMGLSFGLIAVMVGSVSDFGQRLASVSTLTAVVCGLIVAIRRIEVPSQAQIEMHGRSTAGTYTGRRVQLLGALAAVAVAWMLVVSTRAAMGDFHWRRALPMEAALIKTGWVGNETDFDDLIAEARAAAEWEPANVEYRCWLNIYQWYEELRVAHWNAQTDGQRLQEFNQMIREFQTCETVCPTYGLSFAMAGQIRFMGLRDAAGAAEIRKAYELAPTHPAVCFIAGKMDAVEERWDQAAEEFRRAIDLHYSRNDVMDVYLRDLKNPERAAEFFARDWDDLAAVARAVEKDGSNPELAINLRNRANDLLVVEAEKSDAPVQALTSMADLLRGQGDFSGAISHYRRAIDLNYGNADLHLSLARALAESGAITQATQEAGICLRLKPETAAAQRLLADLATPGGNIH